ncbi:MAG: hypothetical protein QOK10_1244 [Pseudonocardiales bacterium]|nr:hypothetical protein [Pseudonocardiales bacterium]
MMALNKSEMHEALSSKIVELTNALSPSAANAGSLASMAYAINQLAEALAWIQAPAQSHGGCVQARSS